MTFREKIVVRILLLVARFVCDDAALAQEIKHLATHIDLYAPKELAIEADERQPV